MITLNIGSLKIKKNDSWLQTLQILFFVLYVK